ncbi:hypothetical protein BC834DRAFT_844753 [Gloeopeniophorella convolvens]|nr:hypothetical protein BC834DRAFT_844753 [Gloeopeniophorella convolvens]
MPRNPTSSHKRNARHNHVTPRPAARHNSANPRPATAPSLPPSVSGGSGTGDLARYIIPKEKINIDDLAQREARYFQVLEEATDHMLAEPVRTKEITAELYETPKFKATISPTALVPHNGGPGPDAYFAWVDKALDADKTTLKDYVLRAHYAFSGLLVFEEYILDLGLTSWPEARWMVTDKAAEL